MFWRALKTWLYRFGLFVFVYIAAVFIHGHEERMPAALSKAHYTDLLYILLSPFTQTPLPDDLQQSMMVLPDSRYIRLCKMVDRRDSTGFEISVFHLDRAPAYRVLSYTHAPGQRISEIDESMFHYDDWKDTILGTGLPKTLMRAITEVRNRQHTDWYWIDFICINQSNHTERSEQMNMMHKILQQAEGVDVWLGQSDEDAPRLLQIIDNLSDKDRKLGSTRNLSWPSACNIEYEHVDTILPGNDTQILARFFSRRWFYQLWAMQEVALAKNVRMMYGSYDIDYESLVRAAYFVYDRRLLISSTDGTRDVAGAALVQQYVLRNVVENPSLLRSFLPPDIMELNEEDDKKYLDYESILAWLYGRNTASFARDPRDYVYGLIGLAKTLVTSTQGEQPLPSTTNIRNIPMKADYSLTVAETYQNFIINLMESRVGIRAIALVQPSSNHSTPQKAHHGSLQLPSWIPNLAYRDQSQISLSNYGGMAPVEHDARAVGVLGSSESDQEQRFFIDSDNLHLFGTRIGVIRTSSQPFPYAIDTLQCLEFGLSLIHPLRDISNRHDDVSETPASILVKTMALGFQRSACKSYLYPGQQPTEFDIKELIVQSITAMLWNYVMQGIDADQALTQEPMLTMINHARSIKGFGDDFLEQELVHWRSPSTLFEWRLTDRETSGAKIATPLRWTCMHLIKTLDQTAGQKMFTLDLDLTDTDHVSNQNNNRKSIPSRRLMAMGSGAVQRGDEIWAVQGSDWPFVLRPLYQDQMKRIPVVGLSHKVATSEKTEHQAQVRVYQFRGEAYVHGIMYGELFDGRELKELHEIIIQ